MLFQMDVKAKSGLSKTDGESVLFSVFCDVQESVNGTTTNAFEDVFNGAMEVAPLDVHLKKALQDPYKNRQKVTFKVATKDAFEIALKLHLSMHNSIQNDTAKSELGEDFMLQLKAQLKFHFTEHLKKTKKTMNLTLQLIT